MTHHIPIAHNGSLTFFVTLPNGTGYSVNLHEFAEGGVKENVPTKSQHIWGGDFQGRETIALQFAAMLRGEKPPASELKTMLSALRSVFRFLDHDQSNGGIHVASIADITDAHGSALEAYLGYEYPTRYASAKRIVDRIRQFHRLDRLAWRTPERESRPATKSIGKSAIRALHMALRTEARQLKAMHNEGAYLADSGTMPLEDTKRSVHWQHKENRAHFLRSITADRLLNKAELKKTGHYYIINKGAYGGPSYIAPMMGARAERGWAAQMRWFHPGYFDISILLWIILLGTGWNLSTVLTLSLYKDISDDVSVDVPTDSAWTTPHLTDEKAAFIFALKDRARSFQIAYSSVEAEWHPYRIIQYAIKITAALRRTVARNLQLAQSAYIRSQSPELRNDIEQLKIDLKSPWLFFKSADIGSVSSMNGNDGNYLNKFIRAVIQKHDLLKQYPELDSISASDPRDTWIQTAYRESDYNVLIAQLAGQHKSSRTTSHYLGRRTYREHSEGEVRKVHKALFAQIVDGGPIDLTRLKLLVANGTITSEQEARLRDPRYRTRVGAGCLSPYSPPRDVAPDHVPGTLCRIQRCTGCSHGVIFDDSLDPLTRALAELVQIQRSMPMTSWDGSSYQDEFESISETLKAFPADNVDARLSHWMKLFEDGQLEVHDVYPTY